MNALTRNNNSNNAPATLNDFDALFKNLFGSFGDFNPEFINARLQVPKMEIEVGTENVVATLPVPGCGKDDISLEVVGDCLTVKVERGTSCDHAEDKRYIRRERSCESFEQTVKLPAKIKGSEASAKYTDGILTITIPRDTKENETHSIDVK